MATSASQQLPQCLLPRPKERAGAFAARMRRYSARIIKAARVLQRKLCEACTADELLSKLAEDLDVTLDASPSDMDEATLKFVIRVAYQNAIRVHADSILMPTPMLQIQLWDTMPLFADKVQQNCFATSTAAMASPDAFFMPYLACALRIYTATPSVATLIAPLIAAAKVADAESFYVTEFKKWKEDQETSIDDRIAPLLKRVVDGLHRKMQYGPGPRIFGPPTAQHVDAYVKNDRTWIVANDSAHGAASRSGSLLESFADADKHVRFAEPELEPSSRESSRPIRSEPFELFDVMKDILTLADAEGYVSMDAIVDYLTKTEDVYKKRCAGFILLYRCLNSEDKERGHTICRDAAFFKNLKAKFDLFREEVNQRFKITLSGYSDHHLRRLPPKTKLSLYERLVYRTLQTLQLLEAPDEDKMKVAKLLKEAYDLDFGLFFRYIQLFVNDDDDKLKDLINILELPIYINGLVKDVAEFNRSMTPGHRGIEHADQTFSDWGGVSSPALHYTDSDTEDESDEDLDAGGVIRNALGTASGHGIDHVQMGGVLRAFKRTRRMKLGGRAAFNRAFRDEIQHEFGGAEAARVLGHLERARVVV